MKINNIDLIGLMALIFVFGGIFFTNFVSLEDANGNIYKCGLVEQTQ